MKKIVFAAFIALVSISFISCKKEKVPPVIPVTIENGVKLMEFDNVTPVKIFNSDSIPTIASINWDDDQKKAYTQLAGIRLPEEKTQTVYIAPVPGIMGPAQAEAYFSGKKLKMASVALVGGLLKQYSQSLIGMSFACTNLPKIDLGSYGNGNGPEEAIMFVSGFIPTANVYFQAKQSNGASYATFYAVTK